MGNISPKDAFAASMAEARRRANIASTLGPSLQQRVQILKVWILPVVLLTARAYYPDPAIISSLTTVFNTTLGLDSGGITIQQMAKMKIVDEKKRREIEKICSESEELKELQAKIKQAYLNKERASQMTENQYRKQVNLVSTIHSQLIFVSRDIGKGRSDRHHNAEKQRERHPAPETG